MPIIKPHSKNAKNKSLILSAVAGLCILLQNPAPLNAQANPVEISLSSAILFALNNNPDIDIAREQENRAAYGVDEANSAYYPSVDVTSKWGYQYNKPATGLQDKKSAVNDTYAFSVRGRQIVYDGGSRDAGLEQTKQSLTSAKIKTRLETQDIIEETLKYYMDIAKFQSNIVDTERFLNKMTDIVADIQLMKEAGAASQAKVDYAQSRMAFAESQRTEIVSALNDSISNLEFLTGRLPPFTTRLPENIDTTLEQLDDYVNYALQNNKEIKLNTSDKIAFQHSLRAQEAEYDPTVAFNVVGEQKNDDGGPAGQDKSVEGFFDLSWRIFDGWARDAARGKIKSQINELTIKDRKIIKELKRDIKLFYNKIKSIRQSIDVTRSEIESNESLQALNIENFELGNIDIIELIEGEERLNSSKLRLNGQIADLYLNTYSLLITIGYLEKTHFCASC